NRKGSLLELVKGELCRYCFSCWLLLLLLPLLVQFVCLPAHPSLLLCLLLDNNSSNTLSLSLTPSTCRTSTCPHLRSSWGSKTLIDIRSLVSGSSPSSLLLPLSVIKPVFGSLLKVPSCIIPE